MKKLIGLLCLPALLLSGELKDSLLQAKKEQKPLMVMVTSESCKFCTKMKTNTLSNGAVKQNLNGFLFKQIDKEDSEAQHYLPAVHYAPTIFFVSPKFRIVNSVEGYLEPADFNKWVTDTRNKLGMTKNTPHKSTHPKRDKWMYDIASAMDYAAQSGKQIMVFVGSSRSKYSKLLEINTLANAKVMSALSNFVWVKVSKGDENAKAYGINPSSVPTVYFMNSDMSELAVAEGYFEPSDFLQWVAYAKSKI